MSGSQPSSRQRYGPGTMGIHGTTSSTSLGSKSDAKFGVPSHPALHDSASFAFPSVAALVAASTATPFVHGDSPDAANRHMGDAFYTRQGRNPTILALERKLAALEGAEAGLAFASGMAAIATTSFAYAGRGIVVVGDVYGGTLDLLGRKFPSLGLQTRLIGMGFSPPRRREDELSPNAKTKILHVDHTDVFSQAPKAEENAEWGPLFDELDAALANGASLVWMESISNPKLDPFPVAAIAARVHAKGALLAVDNTLATPIYLRPLAQGADLVVHSATKYLGGHGDLTAGVLMGNANLLAQIGDWRSALGTIIAPETAARLDRGLSTLGIRMDAHSARARKVVEELAAHPQVFGIRYPGFGGVVTLELHGGRDTAIRFADALQLVARAPSLGSVDSKVSLPFCTTHAGLSDAERHARGIHDGMARLSVGLEDPTDLVADLRQALDAAMGAEKP